MVASIVTAVDAALAAIGRAPARRRGGRSREPARELRVLGPSRRPAAVAGLQLAGPARARLAAQFESRGEDVHRKTGLFLSAHYGASKLRWALDHLPAVREARDAGTLCWGPQASFLVFRLLDEHPLARRSAVRGAHAAVEPRARATGIRSCSRCSACRRDSCRSACRPAIATGRCARATCASRSRGQRRSVGGGVRLRLARGRFGVHQHRHQRVRAARADARSGLRAAAAHRHHPRRRRHHGLHGRRQRQRRRALRSSGCSASWASTDVVSLLPQWLERDGEPSLFLNGIAGLGGPFWKPDFASRYVGTGEPWQQAVAVVESIAFLLQANIDEMAKYLPPARAHPRERRRVADRRSVPPARGGQRTAGASARRSGGDGARNRLPRSGSACRVESSTATSGSSRPVDDMALRARYRRWRALMAEATGV